MNRIVKIAVILALPLMIAACNTMEGAGEDIQGGGKALSSSAEKHK